jgi:diaminohydroxyphosphoribosylaminopyrimidine deaminase/5-amino-6-(5-phosphoribosylamino)uracil reductase
VFCCFAEENKRRALESRGVIVEQVPMQRPPGDNTIVFPAGAPVVDGRPDLDRVMAELGKREITSLIIEGGALVNWAALAAGIVDKIFFYYAPKILAGTGSIPFALGAGYRRISEAASVQSLTLHRFGEDFAVEGYLRDPYRDEIRLVPPLEEGT